MTRLVLLAVVLIAAVSMAAGQNYVTPAQVRNLDWLDIAGEWSWDADEDGTADTFVVQLVTAAQSGACNVDTAPGIAIDTTNDKLYACVVSGHPTGTWGEIAFGSGDVTGPSSSTDNCIARFDGTTGKIVQQGTDCPTYNDEGFLQQTAAIVRIRLKESDTVDADWEIVANGSEFFVNETTDANIFKTTPFTIESGATNDMLVIDTNDRVGIGTNSPAQALDIYDGANQSASFESSASEAIMKLYGAQTGSDASFAAVNMMNSGTARAQINVIRSGADDASQMQFKTTPTGGALTTQVTISPTGVVNLTGHLDADGTGNHALDGDIVLPANSQVHGALRTASVTIEDLSASDDDFTFWAAPVAVTVQAVGCRYDGTASTVATISLEDSAGNAMTHTAPTCVTTSTAITFQTVSSGGALVSGEGLAWDVDNVPDGDDKYTIIVKYTED